MKKDGIKLDKMLENSFTALDLEFEEINEANKCLDVLDQEGNLVTYVIKSRSLECRGANDSCGIMGWKSGRIPTRNG